MPSYEKKRLDETYRMAELRLLVADARQQERDDIIACIRATTWSGTLGQPILKRLLQC
jgi:hypothetical protein